MTEIADPARSPNTAVMVEVKAVTANRAVQYSVTFCPADLGSDFKRTIVIIDERQYSHIARAQCGRIE